VGNDQCARESKLGFVIEKSRSILLLHRFFTEGRLATQASLQPCNDSEYIGECQFSTNRSSILCMGWAV
jgi:hypothetical protein